MILKSVLMVEHRINDTDLMMIYNSRTLAHYGCLVRAPAGGWGIIALKKTKKN